MNQNNVENPNNQTDYSGLKSPEAMGSGSPTGAPNSNVQSSSSTLRMPSQPPSNQSPNQSPPPPQNNQNLDPLKEHKSPIASYCLMLFLLIILVVAVLIFVSWKGWISLGGVEKLWGGGKVDPTPTPTVEYTISPSISTSPQVSTDSSPIVTGNINDSQRKTDLATIKETLVEYYQANSKYPISLETTKTNDANSILVEKLVPSYLVDLPIDPLDPQYYYGYKSNGTTFELTSVLEDKTDSAGIQMGQYFLYKVTN